MNRLTAASLLVAFGLASPTPAQPNPEPKDGKVVIPLSLRPAATPKPLSTAYLLPEYRETIPGNRVQMFLRSFMEQDRLFGKEESERRQKWNEMPIKDLPLNEVKAYAGRLIDRDLYDAARMTQADWQLWYFVRRDGVGTLLPDLQKMRALADVLKTRVRGEIAAGDHAAALHTLKILFALAKTMESNPTLIGHLVGVAIATIGCNALDELVQVSGCPNLYWSLTDLPAPFLDLRPGFQGERIITLTHFDKLLSATGPISDDEMANTIQFIYVLVALAADQPAPASGEVTGRYAKWAADPKRVEKAKARLLETGFQPAPVVDLTKEFGLRNARPVKQRDRNEVVKSMTPLQAVVTDDIRQYEIWRDEQFKWAYLPYPQATAGFKAVEADVAAVKDDVVLTPLLLPASTKVKTAQTRLEQRIAYLRVVEAIRLHAHANGGKLPATLDAIKLPLPVDPFTGKAFEYSLKDGVATLHGANPGDARQNRYYEITIRK